MASIRDAIESLTVGEVRAIERFYGRNLNDISGTESSAGVVWALERRRFLAGEVATRIEWPDVDQWTIKQLGDYFTTEPADVDDDEPESDEGKGGALGA